MSVQVIREFQGEYRWLSNFFPLKKGLHVKLYDSKKVIVPTVEHAFQMCKTTDPDWRERIANVKYAGQAKQLGNELKQRGLIREGWYDGLRDQVMAYYVREKFDENIELAHRLAATGSAVLEEGNTWGDEYWGINLKTSVGENKLGLILMDVRAGLSPLLFDNQARLVTTFAAAYIEVDNNQIVCDAARIFKWAVGYDVHHVVGYYARKRQLVRWQWLDQQQEELAHGTTAS